MEKINQDDFRKASNKVGLLFILHMLSFGLIPPILSKIGIYNQSTNGFLFNMGFILIIACLLFPCDFRKMFLREKKIGILEGVFYVFIFLSIYFPLAIIISNLFSPLYFTSIGEEQLAVGIFILQGIIVPIVEEIVYRGTLLENLRKYGDSFAIVISALIFGMMHGHRVVDIFFAGIFTGVVYVKSNQLSYSILMHLFINLFFTSLVFWIRKSFLIEDINIEFLILTIISMTIAFILYIIAKRKDYPEIKKARVFQIKEIIPKLRKDKEKYKVFFQEGGVIFALIVFFIITSIEIKLIISKLK
ncbi:CPBP family intramembrane metalloprotease [Tissierella carlieri]|uniref:CPBP family intramembrane metalloprotease n=1 Tax=Tissierella carlieri TaxID=689904 RepID=A0ABT1S8V2_9FIRM|nr:CPBP family intramembrane glutamic endopeptidase [Tissierella carlieri]MCQ4922901.1 CPBP family intramembrane metalloprotease [Tissierella carlieri]